MLKERKKKKNGPILKYLGVCHNLLFPSKISLLGEVRGSSDISVFSGPEAQWGCWIMTCPFLIPWVHGAYTLGYLPRNALYI